MEMRLQIVGGGRWVLCCKEEQRSEQAGVV